MLSMSRALSAALCGAALSVGSGAAQAQFSDDVIRIGFITDLSGVYSGPDGPGGVEAIRMAIEEMGGSIDGRKIELITADHQNKADIASAKAREWFDQKGLDMLIGGTNSSAALAMSRVAADKKKPIIVVGAGAPALTNEQCTPYTLNYAYDTVALARGTGDAVVKAGGKTWYFLTADYAFGAALQADTTNVVQAGGGRCWARSSIRCRRATFPLSCCRRKAARPRSWPWPTPAPTPPTRSRRPMNSA